MIEEYKIRRKTQVINSISSEQELRDYQKVCKGKLFNSSLVLLSIPAISLFINYSVPITQEYTLLSVAIVIILLFLGVNAAVKQWVETSISKDLIDKVESIGQDYNKQIPSSNIIQHKRVITRITRMLRSELPSFTRTKFQRYLRELTAHLENLEHKENLRSLNKYSKSLQERNKKKIDSKLQQHPLIVVKDQLSSGLHSLETRRRDLQGQWDTAYDSFGWWQKLTVDKPDFSEMDKRIAELKSLQEKFNEKHGQDVHLVKRQYAKALSISNQRIDDAHKTARKIIEENRDSCPASNELLRKASWFSTFTLSASLWDDFNSAGNVYDALRNVNQNFQGMSDMEIWWETLWMSSDSLNGLASLTKGAYFEQLVANDTGGELFEHFNHKDTDIIIDSVATQLKATDSVSYIESVDSSIPVIATSEVAAKTDAMDSGFSNAELNDSIDLALGGTVIDFADTTADTLFAGLGGLGFFASLRGIARAARRYNNGGDGVEAIFEGVGIAIVGTAKGLVDLSEMAFNMATSRPCRFAGRSVLSGLEKLDRKLFS